MTEQWRDIVGFEGHQVSDAGRVRSLDRAGLDGRRLRGIMRKTPKNNHGYPMVQLRSGGRYYPFQVHRLVAAAFVENPFGKPHVNHLDGNPANSSASNLEWVTRSENCLHAFAVLGRKPNIPRRGPTAIRPVVASMDGAERRFASAYEAARNGFTQASVVACLSGRIKTHKGCQWRYDEAAA